MLSTPVDREHFCLLLTDVVDRYDWTIANWTLMPNHHHLLVKLAEPNLDVGMQRLHGLFAQRWNPRNGQSGHVFFRRYRSIPLLRGGAPGRVSRYIDLNPVRAGLCRHPEDWPWGGYGAIAGKAEPLAFHAPDEALELSDDGHTRGEAKRFEYARAVRERLATTRRSGPTSRPLLPEIIVRGDVDSLREAHETWWYSTRAIATYLGVSVATVHRWLAHAPAERNGCAFRAWSAGA